MYEPATPFCLCASTLCSKLSHGHFDMVMQVHGIHSGACVATFHTALALHWCNMTKDIDDAESQLQLMDKCMHILRTAAFTVEKLASLAGPFISFAASLNAYLVAARDVLDNCMLTSQSEQLGCSMLPGLEFAAERSKIQSFEVQLPKQVAPGVQDTSTVRQETIQALAGVPAPPAPGEPPSAWCAWLQVITKSHYQSWSNNMLLLQQVEQMMFLSAERYLSGSVHMPRSSNRAPCPAALSAAEIHSYVVILKHYSETVAQIESWPQLWHLSAHPQAADYAHTPMLQVQLRSLEALLTWILLCLIHLHVQSEVWEGIRRYKLPVEPDDLRHLVRGGNSAAQHAVTVVAEYICRVADRSSGKVCFSLESEDTLECVVDYASAAIAPYRPLVTILLLERHVSLDELTCTAKTIELVPEIL
jgi:hypothetical protein